MLLDFHARGFLSGVYALVGQIEKQNCQSYSSSRVSGLVRGRSSRYAHIVSDFWGEIEEGSELLQEGLTDEAIAELRRVISESPKNEYGHFFLGQAFYDKKEYQRALKCYVTALELSPRYIGAMIGAGQTLRQLGQLDQAITMGKQILLASKEDADALYLLGCSHFQKGEMVAAQKYYERFMQTNPELEVAQEVEGILQVLRGEATELEES